MVAEARAIIAAEAATRVATPLGERGRSMDRTHSLSARCAPVCVRFDNGHFAEGSLHPGLRLVRQKDGSRHWYFVLHGWRSDRLPADEDRATDHESTRKAMRELLQAADLYLSIVLASRIEATDG